MGQFDPYHKWLGIPPNEQPPNHYRLLGIALFECDPDVIDAAADQRMSYLRQFVGGPYLEQSQRLLNEISSARLCLHSRKDRNAYDAQLKSQLNASEAGARPGSPNTHAEESRLPDRDLSGSASDQNPAPLA